MEFLYLVIFTYIGGFRPLCLTEPRRTSAIGVLISMAGRAG